MVFFALNIVEGVGILMMFKPFLGEKKKTHLVQLNWRQSILLKACSDSRQLSIIGNRDNKLGALALSCMEPVMHFAKFTVVIEYVACYFALSKLPHPSLYPPPVFPSKKKKKKIKINK